MKVSKLSIALLFTAAFSIHFFAAFAEDKLISKTEITEVKIFASGAMITRNARFAIDAGQTILRFENLSSSIQPSSIQVRATGDFTILSVSHQLDYLGPDRKTPEMVKLEDSLQSLNRKRDGILNQVTVLQEEQNLLLANKAIGGANTGVKLEELKNVAGYFRERLLEIKNTMLDLTLREKKLKLEIDKLNNQLALLNNKRNEPYSTILVNVSSAANVSANFTISYYTGNVSWQPAYDIRVKDVSNPVELVYKALVTQNTGEDWNNVKMRISTGNPSMGATAPELIPWYLNFNRQIQPRPMAPSAANKAELQGIQPVMAESDNAESMVSYIIPSQNMFSSEYEITVPYSIPSNNLQYAVQIRDYKLSAAYICFAVPKVDTDAFLVAAVSGWEELDLQPGKSNIYYENSFIGESVFNPATADDTLRISLGRDKRIIIKREKLKDVSGNQFIGQQRSRTFTYETTIKNSRKEAVTLVIEDQLPVSRDKDIEVKMLEASGGEFNPETGKVIWKIEIPAGQQIKKKLSFSVKHPKDQTVYGL